MSKPVIPNLKHQELLSRVILRAKDQNTVSWWWLTIPVYLLVTLFMKSMYMPATTWISNIRELVKTEQGLALFFFIVVPMMIIIVNLISIRKMLYLYGSPGPVKLLKNAWIQVMLIIISMLVILLYFI